MTLRPQRRQQRLPLGILLCLLATSPALAQDLAGDWRLEGQENSKHAVSVVLHVERTGATWTFEREVTRVEDPGDLRLPSVARSRRVTPSGTSLVVEYAPAVRGMCAVLDDADAGDADDDTFTASYYLSGDGRRLYEWGRSDTSWSFADGRRDHATLELVHEARLEDLLGDKLDRYEASGVVATGDAFKVVFDNSTRIGVIEPDLSDGRLVKTKGSGASNFEGLAWDADADEYFALVEYDRHNGDWTGRVWELDDALDVDRDTRLRGHDLPGHNKGFEGLTFARRDGRSFLLALSEGNHGSDGERALDRGHGEVEVFKLKSSGRWSHDETLELPEAAFFSDYSGIALSGDRLAVVSQSSSQLWVGRLDADDWTTTRGTVYRFPRTKSRVLYGSIEGVDWIDERHLVVVSDSADACDAKSESIHVFRLP